MAKQTTHLRFLLSLGDTKMVVLSNEDDLHIYSNQDVKSTRKNVITSEHVNEALAR